jgi:hypothetical protein
MAATRAVIEQKESFASLTLLPKSLGKGISNKRSPQMQLLILRISVTNLRSGGDGRIQDINNVERRATSLG